MWIAVYDITTGTLRSTGTVIADPLPDGLASVPCGAVQPSGQWNPSTLVFDVPALLLAPSWTVYEFLKRLTTTERVAIRTLAKTNPNVEDFMDLLNQSGDVVRANPDVAMGLNYLTSLGTLAPGRTAEILNG